MCDTSNEHFLVFPGSDGQLLAVWTQSSYEGAGDHRIMFARSLNGGRVWRAPMHLVGPRWLGDGLPASWAFPLVSKSGRLYVIYHQHQGVEDAHSDPFACWAGTMDCIYSDDGGLIWSSPTTIPMPRSCHDHPDAGIPPNWVVWQTPIRDLAGRWFTGLTRWVSKARRTPPHIDSWTAWESVVEFMRFENIDDDPLPTQILISCSASADQALRVPHYSNASLSIAQEPSLVRLPDQRLFCVMRTMTGFIWYSVSHDDGYAWAPPKVLRRRDGGEPIRQPLCCCPIYALSDGRFVLVHHNNDGRFQGCEPEDTTRNRRPAFMAVGEFRPHAVQPIWFSASRPFMDNDGVGIGPLGRTDIGVYSSFTQWGGEDVFWHADRKVFLVGKRITPSLLARLHAPPHYRLANGTMAQCR
ncbi:MAG: exo-alpha-sialidase [Phycisphaeraceae bacterium]